MSFYAPFVNNELLLGKLRLLIFWLSVVYGVGIWQESELLT
jgi:hypothetical protein